MLLDVAAQQYIDTLTIRREGETKLGERVIVSPDDNWIPVMQQSGARFVLLGIPEDIGVRANFGIGGAQTLWPTALKALLNMQSTAAFAGPELFIAGAVDCTEWMLPAEDADNGELRRLVAAIDERVSQLIEVIVLSGKIPVVIGGGHNNAYPLLKGASDALGGAIHCINLDAHSDYRVAEGRHSGNGFRYAWLDGFLERYAVVGLHEPWNNPVIMEEFSTDPTLHASTYEDIFIRQKLSFREAVEAAREHTTGKKRGIELDMDAIQGALSSAATPCGVAPLEARQYLHWCCDGRCTAYVHITEGATALRDGRTDMLTAKLAAMLVSDAVKAMLEER